MLGPPSPIPSTKMDQLHTNYVKSAALFTTFSIYIHADEELRLPKAGESYVYK